jgi:hypothetical protein
MTRILVRAGKRPGHAVSPEADHAYRKRGVTGMNAGNHLYFDSVFRLVSTPGTEVVPDSLLSASRGVGARYAAKINEEFDAYVLTMTNSFRPDSVEVLQRYAALIEHLTIPVVVVGIGAQLGFDDGLDPGPTVREATVAFMRSVLNHSAKVSLRGDVTRQYLATLGFGDEHVYVTGCPSMYLRGPDYAIRPLGELTRESKVGLTIAIRDYGFAPFVTRAMRQYPNLMYIAQTNDDLATFLWGQDRLKATRPEFPTYLAHPLLAEDRARIFLDPRTWIDFLADYQYMVGSRIHGNVAALLAHTPATLIAVDKRTQELGEFHDIPTIRMNQLRADDTCESVAARSDWAAFNAGLKPRYDNLLRFFELNDIDTIGRPGRANPEFDRRLAAATLPPPVSPIVTHGQVDPEALIARLAWLRQGMDTDSRRKAGPGQFVPEFPMLVDPPSRRPAPSLARRARRRLGRLKRRLLG